MNRSKKCDVLYYHTTFGGMIDMSSKVGLIVSYLTYFNCHGIPSANFLMDFQVFLKIMQFALDLPWFFKSAFLHDFEVLHAICLGFWPSRKSFKKKQLVNRSNLSIIPPLVV